MGSIRHGVKALSTARARSLELGCCWNSGWRKTLETFSPHWRCWFVEGLGIVQTGRQADRQARRQAGKETGSCCKGMTPGPGVGQECGLTGGVGRAASVELGVETKANKKTWDQGQQSQQSQHSAGGSRTRLTRKRTPAATRIMRHEGAHCAEKKRRYRVK